MGPDGELRVRVRALPAGGAANDAVRRTIAEACDVAPSRISLDRGAGSRVKRVSISGLGAAHVKARWPELNVRT